MAFTNGAYLKAGNILDLGASRTTQTICAWIKGTPIPLNESAIVYKDGNNSGYRLGVYFDKPLVSMNGGCYQSPTNLVLDTQWHFICGVFEASPTSVVVTAFVDGIWQNQLACSGGAYLPTTNSLRVGNGSGSITFFNGLIDEIRIYDRVLSSNEIYSLFVDPQGPTNAQPGALLDIGTGRAYPTSTVTNHVYQLQGRDSPFTNDWYDIGDQILGSGNVEYGFDVGDGPVFLPARRWQESLNNDGYSLQFDGSNDFAFHPHDVLLNLTNSMTLETWVKPNAVGSAHLITKASSPSIVCYSLDLNSANRPLFRIFNSSGTAFLSVTGSTSLVTGQWKHVSASWDGSQGKIILDGSLDGTESGLDVTRVSTISSLLLGGIFGSETFNGCMDQVRIWNIARNEGDVLADYQSILAGNQTGLVGLWKFLADEGQLAVDSTANGFDLNLGSDPTPDSNDPIWKNESFPPLNSYNEIFNFGVPCLVVGHESATGGLYQLNSSTNFNKYAWGNYGTMREGRGDWIDHLILPTNNAEIFRTYGPGIIAGDGQDYLVVDLAAGPSALSYPVSYLSSVPPGGWTDEHKTTKLVFRRILAGTYTMGSPTNELSHLSIEAQHQVTISRPFYIGVFEVTQKQWERVMGNYPSYFTNISHWETRPVEQVNYNTIRGATLGTAWPTNSSVDTNSFMGRLRTRAGMAFDLPTESQWEYAGRASTITALNSGYNLTNTDSDARMAEVGRYYYNHPGGYSSSRNATTDGGTAKGGSYLPNAWGLYDIHGNVWEWCLDWLGTYPGTVTDPLGPSSGSDRVLRGGSWGTLAQGCCAADRGYAPSGFANDFFGFRAALPASP